MGICFYETLGIELLIVHIEAFSEIGVTTLVAGVILWGFALEVTWKMGTTWFVIWWLGFMNWLKGCDVTSFCVDRGNMKFMRLDNVLINKMMLEL